MSSSIVVEDREESASVCSSRSRSRAISRVSGRSSRLTEVEAVDVEVTVALELREGRRDKMNVRGVEDDDG